MQKVWKNAKQHVCKMDQMILIDFCIKYINSYVQIHTCKTIKCIHTCIHTTWLKVVVHKAIQLTFIIHYFSSVSVFFHLSHTCFISLSVLFFILLVFLSQFFWLSSNRILGQSQRLLWFNWDFYLSDLRKWRTLSWKH